MKTKETLKSNGQIFYEQGGKSYYGNEDTNSMLCISYFKHIKKFHCVVDNGDIEFSSVSWSFFLKMVSKIIVERQMKLYPEHTVKPD